MSKNKAIDRENALPAPKIKVVDDKFLQPDIDDAAEHQLWMKKLAHTFGVQDENLAGALLVQSITASYTIREAGEVKANAILAAINQMRPENPVEAMACAQLIALHNQSIKMMERACKTASVDLEVSYLNMAMRLTKTFTALAEFIRKQKQSGRQHISVEHVHVHQGGQAIVGSITHQSGGGDNE